MIEFMEFFSFFSFFVLGTIMGSFLNAAEFRLAHKQSIVFQEGSDAKKMARSKCIHCQHELQARDLVPVLSYLFLGGKCRFCNTKISWQYPIVELATGIVYVGAVLRFGLTLESIIVILFSTILVFVFVYDCKHQLILDVITVPAIVGAFLISWLVSDIPPQHLLLGALIGGGFFSAQYIVSKGKWIGAGDIRLGILMGCMLGWQKTVAALLLAYIGGACIAIALIAFKKAHAESRLAFGTFLTVATYVCLLYGDFIIRWYTHLLI